MKQSGSMHRRRAGEGALAWFVSALLACLTVAPGARAQNPADAYRGKPLNFISASAVGGGNDLYARLIAQHLPDHIPTGQAVVVQNMPGASGVRGAQYLYNVAPRDGLTIGMVQNNLPFIPLFGGRKEQFDPLAFNWLGSPSQETAFLLLWHTVPVETIADAKRGELILGTTGPASTPAFYGRVLAAVFGLKIKAVHGYKGQADAFLAMERGENEGFASTFWSSLKAQYPQWIADKKVKILVQYGVPSAELKDVPFAPDIIGDPNDRLLMEIASAPLGLGRPSLAPPDVPADRVAYLRYAFDAMFRDPRFLGDCEKRNLECDSPVSGAEIATKLAKAYAAPQQVLARLQAIGSATQ
jgi:tripartite-type tricarboxylate transporter receptor subunit TctC